MCFQHEIQQTTGNPRAGRARRRFLVQDWPEIICLRDAKTTLLIACDCNTARLANR
jgi:hypothetical protein